MKMKNRLLLITVLLLRALINDNCASAAKPGAYGLWPGYYGSIALNSRWGLWAEAQYRAYDFRLDLEQLLLRGAVTYNVRPDVQLAAGYAYVRSEPYIPGTEQKRVTEEHRLYQQLILRNRWGRVYLTHRYRVEERFLPDEVFKVRFRYFLGGNLCLNHKGMHQGTAYLSAYNELFIHDRRPLFDRNRLYAGVGYNISKNVRIEGGSMWQFLENGYRPQTQLMLWHTMKL